MSSTGSTSATSTLAHSLLAGTGIPHRCHNPRLVETHISWLVMVGEFVYKLKKPVNLGFLDFTTLAQRQFYCNEELRLNRRTAPKQYLEVLPISGTPQAPRPFDNSGPFDYAVRMRRFDDTQLLSRLVPEGGLSAAMVEELAHALARFHQSIAGAAAPAGAGSPASVLEPIQANFTTLRELDHHADDQTLLQTISAWCQSEFKRIAPVISARRDAGFVRECHGDLHLANIYWEQGPVLFDAIEFSESLRWIDVASDTAFLLMDLASFGHPALANRLLNDYLADTGDFGSLDVMRYYLVYRAMVRAKIAAIRADQDTSEAGNLSRDLRHYLALAAASCEQPQAQLVMMCGLSGTGKTTVARQLAADLGAIHLRSDVERKRLFGLTPGESSRSKGLDIYTAAASARTFERLEHLCRQCLGLGYSVVVDATFIQARHRGQFADLADQLGVGWRIVQTTAPEDIVRARLNGRRNDASEAGFAQYLSQRERVDAFSAAEQMRLQVIDTSGPVTPDLFLPA
ncbi:MAG: AAA family ATPase [Pseudomonadota bacterium]